jgi:branched-chain amino acid transport system ATP-binding protein
VPVASEGSVAQREVVLSVESVSRRFGGLTAVDDVSLQLSAGAMTAVVGPNGAGKTTLFNLLTGQLRPSAGEVRFRGERITDRKPHDRARMGIGRTFQIVRPLEALTVMENAMVGAFARYRRRRAAMERAGEVLETLGLYHRRDVLASSLTLAERKRMEIARALGSDPRILLLDEVMAGLNPVETDAAIEIVRRLNEDGLTVLLIEHDLKVVRTLAEHAIVLDGGRQIAAGTPAEVFADPAVIEAYLGVKSV